jgi:TolB-like protein/tetratricopeptide (TPR) repeat protein
MALEAGTRLGRYEVLGLIGAGGMGEVYKARDTRLLRTVALKVLPPQLASDPARRERFEREARAVSALEHPHICVLYDVGSEGDVRFLVLEHLEGETLAERLGRGRLTREEALRIGVQIADALHAAHGKGIVHRDLKPGNIMLAKTGVKLLDFGLARLTEEPRGEEESTAWRLSGVGMAAGTVPYMSPEQLSGGKVDARSDIWALGVVLYEMLTGRRPFEGGSTATLMVAILQHDPPSLAFLEPLAPPALDHVVGRCLAKDPEDRWQTVRDVSSELGWVSEGRTAAAVPLAERRQWRRRAWTLLGAAALVAGAGASSVWWWRGHTATPSLDPKRVVVAVFENRTGDASLDALGRTAADQIGDGLTRIQGVRVVPGSQGLRTGPGAPEETGGGGDPVRELARKTGAGLVVSGIYTLAGEDIRIQARLTDARGGRFQALDPAVGPRRAPMTVLEAARQRVMGAVAVRTDPNWLEADLSPPTYDAYQEYRVLVEGGDNPILHMRRALELDPDFVLARFDLIGWSFVSGDYPEAARHVAFLEGRKARLPPARRLFVDAFRAWLAGRTGEAYLAAREARKLEPANPGIAFEFSWFAQNAFRFREAVEVLSEPLDWERFYGRSRYRGGAYFSNLTQMLHLLGEHERELLEVRRGERLHPEISWLRDREAYAFAALGRLDEMEGVVKERLSLANAGQRGQLLLSLGLELRAHGHREASATMLARALGALQGCSPEEARTEETRAELALLFRLAGRWDEAHAIDEQLAREAPVDTERALVRAGDLGVLAALRGHRGEALRISDELSRIARPFLFGVHNYERARIAAQLGEKDRAVDLMRTAMGQGFFLSSESNGLPLEPSFDTLRGYPPFEELVKPM